MEEESADLNNSNDSCLNHFPAPRSSFDSLQEPFLNFDVNSELSFEKKSTIFNSLVTLVKTEYTFDDPLQDKAIRFLKSLEPMWGRQDQANQLVTDLVPSSAGSHSGFVESISTLLSAPHSTVVAAALSFLHKTAGCPPMQDLWSLLESDLLTTVLATVQPHTLPISGNETIIDNLIWIIFNCINLALPYNLRNLDITTSIDKYSHREMIFQKVVIPSSQFVTFLISNRYNLNGDLFRSFINLLSVLLRIGPFHRPTLEYVLASPIAMTFSSTLLSIEDENCLWSALFNIALSLEEWNQDGPDRVKCKKWMIQALFSESFEDTLEQMLKYDIHGDFGRGIVTFCQSVTYKLGSNVKRQ
ncbi:hypothetical protein BLNAU_7178 [Blattamonas nauphoetae]|uniref:Uncharacterized protein n=1 Tax=Blattamonas nauphoetae TaxID=2049346 RepID=A0ABQ9Y256_9EUKA|nr:hypothetical protein BLNAU_7178 [Blattamonas nauphoetae]